MTKLDWFKSQVFSLTETEQIDLFHNYVEYVRCHKYGSEYIKLHYTEIYPMEEFDDFFKDKTPLKIVEMCNNYHVDHNDRYFAVGIFGIKTLADPSEYISHHCDNIFKYDVVWKHYINDNDWQVA